MTELFLEKVGPENLAECGIGCISNPKHVGHGAKVEWLKRRFPEGLRFFLFRDERGKPLAFLEYVPGAFAWRPVHAEGWLFIHCLWVYAAGQKVGGLGRRLIQACLQEAEEAGARGVAAMVSEGPWMAGRKIFLNQGFEVVAEEDRFALVAHRLREGGETPRFRNIDGIRNRYQGLHVIYAPQCPMLPKSVEDLREVASAEGLELKVTVIRSPEEAQEAPCHYGVFCLLWNGRILSDHYVSKARFRNLLKTIA
jgi:hypothetical protein